MKKDFLLTIGLPLFGKSSNQFFIYGFKVLNRNNCNVDINDYYATPKTGSYFQLKCSNNLSLISNIVYKFICLYDTNVAFDYTTFGCLSRGAFTFNKGFNSTEKH